MIKPCIFYPTNVTIYLSVILGLENVSRILNFIVSVLKINFHSWILCMHTVIK